MHRSSSETTIICYHPLLYRHQNSKPNFLTQLNPLFSVAAAVGGIVGFSLVFAGGKGVNWNKKTSTFPYVSGFVPVVLSWFISPVAAALVSGIIFLLIRTLVLRRQNSTKIAIWVSAIVLFGFTHGLHVPGTKAECARMVWLDGTSEPTVVRFSTFRMYSACMFRLS